MICQGQITFHQFSSFIRGTFTTYNAKPQYIAFEFDAEAKYGMSVEVQPMHEENDISLIAS